MASANWSAGSRDLSQPLKAAPIKETSWPADTLGAVHVGSLRHWLVPRHGVPGQDARLTVNRDRRRSRSRGRMNRPRFYHTQNLPEAASRTERGNGQLKAQLLGHFSGQNTL